MPIVIVEAIEGRTVEQKRKLVKDITEVVMEDFDVDEPDKVTVIIHDVYKNSGGKGGKLFMER